MRKYHAHKSTNGSSRASRVCWPRGNIKVAPTSDSNLLRQYAADTGLSRRGTTADTDQDTGLQDWDSGEGLGRQIDHVFRLATSVPKKLCADLYDLVREDCSGGEFLCVSTVIEWLQRATE
ncbi:hypothetical protein IMSHALPRED_006543 [Imshaugia aleurites]|uniref:Uncharacterized protein n=1 Tax=Imshaugia aleurites TaxID=172621 RepID=A0A8H3I5D3_9LECA|nr:hypothetical protein IMSHALPRED_006543 [Imshaugia aleurites]